ncbi:hypothetical protein [Nonomuraea endophytica]|uniref:DUF4352 domain-containing protein n=1 Tax=Nonomuraea endophytica TaxID=714136 RepID=A0A7W8A1U1_9ACTN|nr:hypothetical protein [Nonomuraea endophytica]MBB5078022.1 hypothetical protein [Nonomuraea endophytica]
MKQHMFAVAFLATALTGCGLTQGGGGEEKVAAPPKTASASASAGQTAAPQGEGMIATRRVNDDQAVLKVEVTELRREGKMATLSWTLTVEKGEHWSVGTKMGRHNTDYTVSNVSLIDVQNAKRYRAAMSQGPEGTCACTETDATTVQTGGKLSFQATYAAPPPEVGKVNITLGELGGLTDVPIS